MTHLKTSCTCGVIQISELIKTSVDGALHIRRLPCFLKRLRRVAKIDR